MNFNKWYGACILACILFWMAMFSLFRGCSEAQAREKGPGFYVEYGQSLTPVENQTITKEYGWGYVKGDSDYVAYTDINIHYTFQFWNIQLVPFANLKTWAIPSVTQLDGKPFCDIYTVGCEVFWKGISVSVDHYCAHAVRSNDEMWKVKDYRMGQNMNEIKIRYSFN
jgi:hypothetical protein